MLCVFIGFTKVSSAVVFCETKPTSPLPHALTIDAEDWAALMCMYSGRPIPVSPQFGGSVADILEMLRSTDGLRGGCPLHVAPSSAGCAVGARTPSSAAVAGGESSVYGTTTATTPADEGVRAPTAGTFFVVAQHAAEEPAVVREIVARGHELGSHAWTHHLVGAFSADEFREDLRRSVSTLEDLSGRKVYGHRSPLFSLMPDHVWALEAMAEVGLEYDSSVFTLAWHRAGLMIPEQPFIFRLPSGRQIVEFPAPARKWGPMTVRFIGGRGARLAPTSLFLRHLEEREEAGLPGMLYFHTYEMGSGNLAQYVPRSIGRKRLAIQAAAWAFRVGAGRLQRLVRRLLRDFQWAPMRQVIARLREEGRLPVFELPGG